MSPMYLEYTAWAVCCAPGIGGRVAVFVGVCVGGPGVKVRVAVGVIGFVVVRVGVLSGVEGAVGCGTKSLSASAFRSSFDGLIWKSLLAFCLSTVLSTNWPTVVESRASLDTPFSW